MGNAGTGSAPAQRRQQLLVRGRPRQVDQDVQRSELACEPLNRSRHPDARDAPEGERMTDELKRGLLIVGVVVLVGVAGVTGYNSLKGNSEPRLTDEFQRMSTSEKNHYLDERERKRRAG